MLDRLSIVDVDINTPKIVLEEIAEAHGIRYISTNEDKNYIQRVIDKIHKAVEEEKDLFSQKDYLENPGCLKKIARYVNSNCTWKKPALLKAFKFLNNFHSGKNLDMLFKDDYTYGPQTVDNPISVNANVLYAFLCYCKINTNFQTSFQQMCELKDMVLNFDEVSLKNNIFYQLRFSSLTPASLINMFSMITPNSHFFNPSNSNLLKDNIEKTKNRDEILKKVALEFKLDLSDIENLEELETEWRSLSSISNIENKNINNQKINKNIICSGAYFPINKGIRERLKNSIENRFSIDNIFLDCKFNPKLSEDYYSKEDLLKLCKSEGHKFVIELGLDPYALLQTLQTQPTFYHGKVSSFSLNNKETTFLESYNDLSYHSVILYTTNSQIETEGKKEGLFFTYAELCETFSVKKQFRNPITGEVFGEENINKLFLMTQEEKKSDETEKEFEERRELGEEIERIRLYNENTDRDIKNFVTTYESLDEWNKKRIEFALTTLLDTAMYMRNWDGKSNYPLSSEATNFPPDAQILVDHRVTQSLLQFDQYVKELGLIGKTILQLPLIMYVRESDKFLSVTDANEGLTIEQRLKIVKKGETDRGGNSCIRLSSNRFIATSYYYMVLIGMRIPFSINQVTYIS